MHPETRMRVVSASGRKEGNCSSRVKALLPAHAPASYHMLQQDQCHPWIREEPILDNPTLGPKHKLLWAGTTQGHVAENKVDFSPGDYQSFAAQAQGKLWRMGILTFHLRGGQMRGRGDRNPSKGVMSKPTVWKRLSPTRVLFPARIRLLTGWSGCVW